MRFLQRRVAGGLRPDVVSEWTRIIGEFDAISDDDSGGDVTDVGQSGDDGLVTRSKGNFTGCIKEGLIHWRELSSRNQDGRKKRDTSDVGESRVPLERVAGNDIVDDGAREVQVLPRPPRDQRWTQRQVNNVTATQLLIPHPLFPQYILQG